MYRGKHYKRSPRRSGKSIALLVSLLLIIGVAVGGVITFLIDTDEPLQNQFTPSKVTTKVEETLSGATKSNVYIQNTGNTEAWIRAAVVITWKDEAGNVYGQAPVACTESAHENCNADYAISYSLVTSVTENSWIKGADGFYYYTSPVKSVEEDENNCCTEILISECVQLKTMVVGDTTYYLTAEIISSGIQSKPASVFNTEWASSGFEVDTSGDTWILKEVENNGANS